VCAYSRLDKMERSMHDSRMPPFDVIVAVVTRVVQEMPQSG
jgi:hypothetical protein